jgi:hypothetical protein
VKLTVACWLPGVALTFVGGLGATGSGFGVTVFDETAWLVPRLFVAVIVKVYGTPFVSPLMSTGLPVIPGVCWPPGLLVTV